MIFDKCSGERLVEIGPTAVTTTTTSTATVAETTPTITTITIILSIILLPVLSEIVEGGHISVAVFFSTRHLMSHTAE